MMEGKTNDILCNREDGMFPKKQSAVNHPSHYNSGNIETIDAIEDWGFGQGFNLGNAIKYISRANHKNACIEDLEKARWYIDREISRLKKTPTVKQEESDTTTNTPVEVDDNSPTIGLSDIDDDMRLADVLPKKDALEDNFKLPELSMSQIWVINNWFKTHNNGDCACTCTTHNLGDIAIEITPLKNGGVVIFCKCRHCDESFILGGIDTE